jgi:hypothetical protein
MSEKHPWCFEAFLKFALDFPQTFTRQCFLWISSAKLFKFSQYVNIFLSAGKNNNWENYRLAEKLILSIV